MKRTAFTTDIAALLLRVCFGFTMLFGHGWGKFLKLIGDGPIKWADPIGLGPEISLGLATFAELFCAGALIIGLFTRLATIPLIITMGVAFFIVHIDDPFNKMESPLMYMTAYIAILLLGAGRFSVDHLIRGKK
jgi:putative oxidoreductase